MRAETVSKTMRENVSDIYIIKVSVDNYNCLCDCEWSLKEI